MSRVSIEDRHGRRWLDVSPSRLAVDALSVGSIATAVGSLLMTSHRGPVWPAAAIVFVALVATIVPDGWPALATIAAYSAWWFLAVRDVTTPWVVPAAVSLLVFHAVAASTSGPSGIVLARPTIRAWASACVLVSALTAAVFGMVSVSVGAVSTPPVVVGATLVLVVLVMWAASRRAADA